MPTDEQTLADRISTLEDLSDYLFELANMIHEHRDMLFRLSDEAHEQAEKLRLELPDNAP